MLVALLALEPSVARADGGALRFSEQRDGRRISVFTSPTPLRAGPVDVSVLVQDAATGKPLPDMPIVVHAQRVHHGQRKISARATTEAATNKLLQAAPLELSEPGWWHLEIVVAGANAESTIGLDVEVADAQPAWLSLSLWIGWPLVVVVVFILHQWSKYTFRAEYGP